MKLFFSKISSSEALNFFSLDFGSKTLLLACDALFENALVLRLSLHLPTPCLLGKDEHSL